MPIKNSNGINLAQTTLSPNIVSVLYGAPDNAITHGTSFANWTVDAGSTKASDGITVKQNSTSEFAQVSISGLAANTTYWGMLMISAKSAGVTGANGLAVEVAGSNGSNFQAVGGGQLSLASAVTSVPYYFKIQTDATAGPWLLRLIHIGSSNAETVKFSDFRVFPIATRSSAKIAVMGDRAGGFTAQPASDTNKALIASAADTKNVVVMGDQADASNTYGACDPLIVASCVTTSGSAVVTAPAGSFTDLVLGVGVTGTGIPAGATVLSVDSGIQVTLSANATASGTVSLTFTSVLQKVIAARGGDRYVCIGNHDYDGSRETEISGYFTSLATNNNSGKFYYSVVLGQCEFFILNDNDASSGNAGQELTDNAGGISATQAAFQASTAGQWIVNALANSTARWKIVIIHHAVYSSSSTGGGWTSNRWAWKTLGAHLVFQAHNHGVERIYKDGLYFITQAMGGGNHHGWATKLAETQFRFDSTVLAAFATTYGYWKLSDAANDLVLEYFDQNHLLWDRVKISRS